MSVRGTHVPEHLRLPIAGVTPPPTEKQGQRLFPTGNFRFYRPVYRDKTPPGNPACPTGEQIQKYLDHVKHDRYLDGYLTICEDNPMPSVTGRVCYHPCETACNRAEHDEPIGIRGVERFLGDFGLKLADNPVKRDLPPLNGPTVAIVGSGPGGLGCAYHLRRNGYASVIFEALDQPGGMLRAGIPAWHLPEEILNAEIAKLLDLGGIEIRCGVRAGPPDGPSLDELARDHDAVFLALGQDVGRRLDAAGGQARGVIGALEFLRETGLGRPVQIGREVLVIGGGNTASDAARSAIRLGGGEATIVSLESEAGLLIHEGQLFYQQLGLRKVVDLGEWWKEWTDLPLPMGGNCIRRDLGAETIGRVSDYLHESIRYSLDNRRDALAYAMQFARDMDTDLADRFVGMWVNQLTLDYTERGRRAVQRLLDEGAARGVIPHRVEAEFVG